MHVLLFIHLHLSKNRSIPVGEIDSWGLDGKQKQKSTVNATCFEVDVGAESGNMLGDIDVTEFA